MVDKAHRQTDIMLARLQNQIAKLYRQAQRKINKEVDPQDDNAIKKTVDIIVSANETTAELINQNSKDIYALNFKFACDDIVRQLTDSGV